MANAYNAFHDFKSEYRLQQHMQMLADTLVAVEGPDGQPLIPNQAGTPLNNMIRRLELQPAAPQQDYDFELAGNTTVEQIQTECIARNINIFNVIRQIGNRAYYDITYGQSCE